MKLYEIIIFSTLVLFIIILIFLGFSIYDVYKEDSLSGDCKDQYGPGHYYSIYAEGCLYSEELYEKQNSKPLRKRE